jgi:hypothetical protein
MTRSRRRRSVHPDAGGLHHLAPLLGFGRLRDELDHRGTKPVIPNRTNIDVIVVRDGKNFKGWVLGLILGTIGKPVLKSAFENSVKAVEMRNSPTSAKSPSRQSAGVSAMPT